MSCLVEVHDEKEIETALNIGAKIIKKKYNLITITEFEKGF
jgi:indole-3-glycerol phosphate synthase